MLSLAIGALTIGAFAVTISGLEPHVHRFEKEHDDYGKIMLQALADILRDDARSVLFSSHNTRDIEQLADTISFVHQGRLLASQDKESFLDDWRRIICQGTWPADQHAWPEIAMTRPPPAKGIVWRIQ